MAGYATSEIELAKAVLPCLTKEMLCLADRGFFGYAMWKRAAATGADLLWRIRKDIVLPCEKRLPDGSYRSRIYASGKDRRRKTDGIMVRVVAYRLEGVEGAEPLYRLITTILDHAMAPAEELAALYHERWEIETALDEVKVHQWAHPRPLRSKHPREVVQEVYGLLLAHLAIRTVMHQAALREGLDPDRLSFTGALRVLRRAIPRAQRTPPEHLPFFRPTC